MDCRCPHDAHRGRIRFETPDGKRLTFGLLYPSGAWELVRQVADGSAPPEKIGDRIEIEVCGWKRDDELIGLTGDRDICVLADVGGKATVRPIMQTPGILEFWPAVSPDGRWLAYGSDMSRRFEIYIQPYPGPGERQTVSVAGGQCPVWNPRGGELFYLSLPDKEGSCQMMAVAIPTRPDGRPGTPQSIFSFKNTDLRFNASPAAGYDVARDGRSFYTTRVIPTQPQPPVTSIHIILNWLEEVKARTSGGK